MSGLIIHRRNAGPPETNLQNRWTFRAEDVTLATGISAVTDRMGNKNLVQSTSWKQPAQVLSGINSLPVANFDGADDQLDTDGTWSALSHPFTMAGVFKFNWLGSASAIFTGTTNAVEVGQDRSNFTMQAGSTLTSSSGADTSAHYFVSRHQTSTNAELRIDGASEATGDDGTLTLSGLQIGVDATLAYASMYLAELLVYSADVTGSDLTRLENYFASTYAI